MSHSEENFTWTDGDSVRMVFFVRNKYWVPSSLTLRHGTFLKEEHVVVSIGNTVIDRYVAKGLCEKVIDIPPSAIKVGGWLCVTLSLPDAVSPRDLGKGKDGRSLALTLFSVEVQ